MLLVACAVVAGWYYGVNDKADIAQEKKPDFKTASVERGPIRLVVASTGRVVANLDIQIKCKASGQVITLPYDVSDKVKKGDILLELDPVDEERRLKQAQISLSSSEARLIQAKKDLSIAEENLAIENRRAGVALKDANVKAQDARAKAERVKELFGKSLASQERFDTAETTAVSAATDLENAHIRIAELKNEEQALELKRQDLTLARAQVESDRITLSLARQSLKDTQVLAPIDGVVTTRDVQIGQIISSGISNVGGGTTVLTVSDLSRVFVLASVDESDIGKVKVGQATMITVDAFSDKKFNGKVVRIATRGVNISNVVTFEVKIEVLGEEKYLLKPEMTANVEIIAEEKDDVLLVSSLSIYRKKGQRFVWVLKGEQSHEERPVETGINDGVMVEVVNGLNEGETIIIREGEAESRWRSSQSLKDRRKTRVMRTMFGGKKK